MNRTITTSTIRRQCLRQSLCQCLHHAALALITLLALVAASCTADALDNPDTPAGNGNGNPDGIITFAIAPRPGFTEVPVSGDGTASADAPATRSIPATRAEQTDNATRWEQGDILWLVAQFFQDKQDVNTFDTRYISALKYDANEWRYLTQAEAEDLNTGSIPNFTRLVRWPRGWKDWVDPAMHIAAYYAGSGKPDADGTITINPTGEVPTTPLIVGRGMFSPDVQLVPLEFMYEEILRVRIPAGCKVELTNAEYWSTISFSIDKGISSEQITEIPAQSEDTDVFLYPTGTPTAKLTRDNISCTFTFPTITDEYGNLTYTGASYTLTPYTSGTQSPVADYDLTIATEDDLRALARAVNAGEKLPNGKPFAEARVLQTENIELTKEWVPIGNADTRFRGAYNGNGKTIAGLTITTTPTPDANNSSYTGLFGYAEGAVLTGIRLREVGINITEGSGADDLYVGSIIGWLRSSTLSLCSADGTVNVDGDAQWVYTGGIAGVCDYSTISRCRADIEVTTATTNANGSAYAGGITGRNNACSFILSCEAPDKTVISEGGRSAYAGGITGSNATEGLIAFCRTGENTVIARNAFRPNYAGGLIGHNRGYLYSSYSRATANVPFDPGNNYAGAIIGRNSDNNHQVQYCYGTGPAGAGSLFLPGTFDNIFYENNPDLGEIYDVMTGYEGKVESLTDNSGTYYPFTTSYNPSATPAYGIIPQRAVWTKDAWKDGGTDPTFPEINFDYEGGNNE